MKSTLLGMASPTPELPPAPNLSAGADAPTPVEVPLSGSESSIQRAAAVSASDPSKPTGVAKPYVPKDDLNTPAVVVDAAVMHAGETAAQAEAAARRARAPRSANSATIPGNIRVVPHGRHITPDIEALDSDFAAMKPSRKPLMIVIVLLAAAAAAGVFFAMRPSKRAPVPIPSAITQEAPPPAAVTSDVSAAASASANEPGTNEPGTNEPAASVAVAPVATSAEPPAESASPAAAAPPAAVKQTRKPAAAPTPVRVQAPAKKAPAKRAGTTSPSPAKGKAVIVRESPF